MINKINTNKNKLLTELCVKQRKKADKKYFLELKDLIRLLKNIDYSIFNNTECILWKGYLTKCNNQKSCYINFYLKKRKLALHRILYINYIDDLDDKHYLKYTCKNSGKCCNLNHIIKVYDNVDDNKFKQSDISDISNVNISNINIISTEEKSNIIIKNVAANIKITKINNNTNNGKIIIIFDD